jgi:DNA-binding beta-propeller fold protein YncE
MIRRVVLRWGFLAIVCIFAGSLVFRGADTPNLLQPVALWPAASGGLYALDRTEGLFYIPGGGADLYIGNSVKVAAFRPSWQAIDLAAVRVGSEDRIYVLLGQETIGMLACYTNRQFERSWISKTLLTGIAPDPAGHRLFLSGALKNEIYAFDWNDPGASPTKLLTSLRESQILGPLAFDPGGHTLYVGDERAGVVLGMDVQTREILRTFKIGGQPSGLALDPSGQTLVIVDSVGRKVWRTDVKTGRLLTVSNSREFRQPSSVAIDSTGGVWVGDQEAKAIFRLSSNGNVTAYHLLLRPDAGGQP